VSTNNSVYVIIPVYNEGKVIREVVDNVLEYFPNVVCVDDGSKDNSISEISKTKARLVKHPLNLGQGGALQTGLDYALLDTKAKYFITFDADGQHSITDAQKMLDELKKEDFDVILGSRFLEKTSASNVPLKKRLLLKLAVWFTLLTSGLELTDTHNGLRVFNRKAAETIYITLPDMAHASEILTIVRQERLKYKEVPVTIQYSEYSMSKGQSMLNAVNIIFDLLVKGKR
jgi:glycosyltransferase involved in cell wall biosynthesis